VVEPGPDLTLNPGLLMIDGLEHIVRENVPLAPFTTLRLGGVAEYFAEPTNEEELVEIVRRFAGEELPIRLVGGGSNLLVRDEGVPGLVIHLAAPHFCQLVVGENGLTVGGGVRLSHFVSAAVREGFAGPDQLAGIPGTVGGALHCNSGAGGSDIGSWVTSAVAITRKGERVERDSASLSFSYRSSSLNELAIISARFQFQNEASESLTKQLQTTWIVRSARQPALNERCAYVFKDHGGESAGSLIERAGLGGTQVGKAEVSGRHSNFIVAHDGATSADVLRLIELIRRQVADRLDIELALALQVW